MFANASEGSAFSLGKPARASQARVGSDASLCYVPSLELSVVRKSRPGFDRIEIARLRQAIADVASGRHGPSKFLVLDFGKGSGPVSSEPEFDALLGEAADLILEAPVVSIAWCRGRVQGGDLELALACSMIVSETGAEFLFDFELVESLRSYARLAHRIGFVQAERLLETEAVLTAEAMLDLHLAKAVVPATAGDESILSFVQSRMRRHNSAYGIYRAQRMAMPAEI